MNLDFGAEPLFSWYVVLLCLSGIAMFVLSAIGRSGQSTGVRAFTALVGAAFLGYGVYLGFIFDGGSYLIFFKAFILPAILLINFIRALATRSTPQPPQHQPYPAQPAYGPQPTYNGQPAYGAQPAQSANPTYGAQPAQTLNPTYGAQPTYNANPSYGTQPGYTPQPGHNGRPAYNAPYNQNPNRTAPNHPR